MDYIQIRELYHHGIKGQKWGIRRFQNEDGSLTAEGEARYGISSRDMKKYIDAENKANHKVYEDWDSGSTTALRNRANAIEENKKHLQKLSTKINSNSILKNNNLEFKYEYVKDKWGTETVSCLIKNKKTGDVRTYEDPSDIEYTITDDLIELGVNQKDLLDREPNIELEQLFSEFSNTDLDINSLQEDPHYGRDNIDREYDFGDMDKETISKIQNAIIDLKQISREEIKNNPKQVSEGRQKALSILTVIGFIGVGALSLWAATIKV